MFIDYLTVMLINLVAGLGLLALHLVFFLEKDTKRLAPGFLVAGFVGGATGLHMTLTWPLPGSHNILFGETSLLFGVLFFVAGLALLKDWDLLGVGLYALVAGVAVILLAIRIRVIPMTKSPTLSMLGYLFAGVGAILTVPAYWLKKSVPLRVVVALVLLAAAAIWTVTALGSYWTHLESFARWVPGGPAPASGN